MIGAELIDNIDAPTRCAACGADCRRFSGGGLYIPAGGRRAIAYLLCRACCRRMRSPMTKHDVMNAVELRLDSPRGSA